MADMGLRVDRGTMLEIDVVEGDLLVGDGATVKAKSGERVVVKGKVEFEGDSDVLSSLEARDLRGKRCRVNISGDLIVSGSIYIEDGDLVTEGQLVAKDVDVDRRVVVRGNLKCEMLSVGGSLEVGGDVEAVDLSVGGSVTTHGSLKGSVLKVGGSFDVDGIAELERLEVGGRARVGGGSIDRVDVGGTFESTGKLKFGRIDVGGTVRLAACEGEGKVSVGGVLRVEGDFTFDEVSVGGTLEVLGSAEGNSVDVGGTVKVSEDAVFRRALNVGGFAGIRRELRAGSVSVGGSLETEVCLADKVRVGGRVETQRGVKSKLFEIGKHGKVIGPVVAEHVEARDNAELDDVYAGLLVMGRGSSARNVYVKRAVLESECKVSGELIYTEELELGERLRLRSEPKRAEQLPEPPI
jgi:cytoskeletal protein CcmA (bactofilin family)